MPTLSNFKDRRSKSWCAVIVLVAVCTLTISVTTRYSSPWVFSSHTVKTIRTHASPDTKRQRLAKNAADWMPPVLCFGALQAPSFYSRIVPARPPVANLFFEESLYNRPPPASEILS